MRIRDVGAFAVGVALVLLASGCGSGAWSGAGDVTAPPAAAAVSYVAPLPGTEVFLGLVVDQVETPAGRAVVAYACDGGLVGEWFTGTVNGAETQLDSAGGARLALRLADGAASGTLTFADGIARTFTAPPAVGDGGVYRAEGVVDGGDVVAGWVVLADGTQRGALDGAAGPAPALGPPRSTALIGTTALPVSKIGSGSFQTVTVTPNLGLPSDSITLNRNDVRSFPIKAKAGVRIRIVVDVELGDVDIAVFDQSGSRVAVGAKIGPVDESVELIAPGPVRLEVRAVVNSRFGMRGAAG